MFSQPSHILEAPAGNGSVYYGRGNKQTSRNNLTVPLGEGEQEPVPAPTPCHSRKSHIGAHIRELRCPALDEASVFCDVVKRIPLKGQGWWVVVNPHQEDPQGAQAQNGGDQEKAEAVHSASNAVPVVFLLKVKMQ